MKNELTKDNGIKIDKAYYLGNKKYGYTFTKTDEHKLIKRYVFAGAEKDTISFDEI